ncbi:GGDEF domain-containing protein [Paucibacter sp. AS339]|uniref:GGDEF domain-containing protein n=1 Tax=Paucibacter hankyongi TaxID=3133434 RepID=UPI00309BE883
MTEADAPLPQGMADILMSLHEESPLLVALFDARDRLRHANKAWRQAYVVGPDEQPTWADIMRDNHAQRHGAAIETDNIEAWIANISSRRGKLPFRAFEADLCDGRWIWMTETSQAQGWMLCVGSEITPLRQDSRSLRIAHSKALAAAQTDALTGLSNRRRGLQLLQEVLSHSESWPICVVTFDLDDFKQINDRLGHAAGDRVICDFASQMQSSSRREDGCARIGGEEFLLILPAAGLPQAQSIVERLLSRVRVSRPLPEHPERGYTCSAGLALAVWGESAETLLARADKALYQAKADGRDRIAIAPP